MVVASFTPLDPRKEYLRLQGGESVYEYIVRNVKERRIFVGVEGEEPDLAYAIRSIGNEPFVWSSDFPHEVNIQTCGQEIQEIIENEELSDADLEAVLSLNAAKLYKIRTPAKA